MFSLFVCEFIYDSFFRIDLPECVDLGEGSNDFKNLDESDYEILDVDGKCELNNFLESQGKTD